MPAAPHTACLVAIDRIFIPSPLSGFLFLLPAACSCCLELTPEITELRRQHNLSHRFDRLRRPTHAVTRLDLGHDAGVEIRESERLGPLRRLRKTVVAQLRKI